MRGPYAARHGAVVRTKIVLRERGLDHEPAYWAGWRGFIQALYNRPMSVAPVRLPGVEGADGVYGVGLGGCLVVSVAQDPGEAQREAAGVAGAALDSVEGDLHD